MVAVITGCFETVSHLLSASADVSVVNQENNSVFDEALRLDDDPLQMIEVLKNRFMFPSAIRTILKTV
eukprot:TRINITY_DN16148_c0_g1_i1.p1 TRINITY_DN16148_c0_g1~~TRINITY_DN16148_c0_g1_i1.p1  ORF type:complete len:68 (-),score=14.41 TRINITY_DN16148_c0_g1_i1:214-417(-)